MQYIQGASERTTVGSHEYYEGEYTLLSSLTVSFEHDDWSIGSC